MYVFPKKVTLLITAKQNIQYRVQHAKEVVSDSHGLVELAVGLVNSVIDLPDEQVIFFEEIE